MYKKILTSFDLEFMEQCKAEVERILTPELLFQLETFKKDYFNNKEHFDRLKEMHHRIYTELAIHFPEEISRSKELTEDQFEKEYESFRQTEAYTELSEKISELSPGINKVDKFILMYSTFVLNVCLDYNLNSVEILKILEIIVCAIVSKQDIGKILGDTSLYSGILLKLRSSMSKNQEIPQK